MRLFDFVFSYDFIKMKKEIQADFFTFALSKNIDVWKTVTGENEFTFITRKKYSEIIKENFSEFIVFEKRKGLFEIFKKVCRRPGIIAGMIFSVLILYFSSTHLWDVRISGNVATDDDMILERLQSLGIGVGTKISDIQTDRITVEFLSDCEDISYITLNIRGNVAYVDVIESIKEEKNAQNERVGANVVARCDAIIEDVIIIAGRGTVTKGSVVRKGDILISGIGTGINTTGIKYAKGEVLGRVNHNFRVEIPLNNTKKNYIDEKNLGYNINFFGFSLNIFKYSGNLPEFYDTIESKEQLSLFGKIDLPIYISKSTALEYNISDIVLPETDAVALAYRRLNSEIAATLSGSMVVSKSTEGHFEDGKFIINSNVISIEDISETLEFNIG